MTALVSRSAVLVVPTARPATTTLLPPSMTALVSRSAVLVVPTARLATSTLLPPSMTALVSRSAVLVVPTARPATSTLLPLSMTAPVSRSAVLVVPISAACNFDASATIDDGSCESLCVVVRRMPIATTRTPPPADLSVSRAAVRLYGPYRFQLRILTAMRPRRHLPGRTGSTATDSRHTRPCSAACVYDLPRTTYRRLQLHDAIFVSLIDDAVYGTIPVGTSTVLDHDDGL